MIFRRKGHIRRQYDRKFIELLEELKQEWMRQKRIVEQSLEPSEEVLCHLQLAEVKYFYALREAKLRKVSLRK
ncbi:YaaL family protein [Ectobacillus sp. JY-23]|uniref:YaaL family protein n=1 Tax=Ectobacillus sp. JY-23 TaxID=2933872 RepID=UPI001FF5D8DB|nr:YaaL family protein [Ectobacillus sp. JY-23]UOY91395.1 YaaL family protein [Ectobacillus sp. JY-23]